MLNQIQLNQPTIESPIRPVRIPLPSENYVTVKGEVMPAARYIVDVANRAFKAFVVADLKTGDDVDSFHTWGAAEKLATALNS